jgi:F0F1-type ATP synthase epsilon subunit
MIKCTITTQNGTKDYDDIKNVTLPGYTGQMQIYPGHAEVFVLLQSGFVVLSRAEGGAEEKIRIQGGECTIRKDKVMIIL